jgi:hypothetical protein
MTIGRGPKGQGIAKVRGWAWAMDRPYFGRRLFIEHARRKEHNPSSVLDEQRATKQKENARRIARLLCLS